MILSNSNDCQQYESHLHVKFLLSSIMFPSEKRNLRTSERLSSPGNKSSRNPGCGLSIVLQTLVQSGQRLVQIEEGLVRVHRRLVQDRLRLVDQRLVVRRLALGAKLFRNQRARPVNLGALPSHVLRCGLVGGKDALGRECCRCQGSNHQSGNPARAMQRTSGYECQQKKRKNNPYTIPLPYKNNKQPMPFRTALVDRQKRLTNQQRTSTEARS